MTARNRIPNYEPKLREYTNFAVRGVKKICRECGPRPPCSEAELKSQQMMQKELESCCDETRLEPFQAAPKAFMGWVRLSVVLGIGAAIAYNLATFLDLPSLSIVSAVLLAIAVLFMVLEFLLYKQALDIFLPKKQSQNLVGVQKPTGEVKRRLILCGHADSANEWRFTYLGVKLLGTPRLLVAVIVGSMAAILYGLAVSVIAVAQGGTNPVLGYVFAGLCLILCATWFFENKKRPVEGANDNLSGCFTAMAAARMLHETNSRLEHTELVVMCSGCEEIGLRGAKAFVKAHAAEYKDVETVFIALDTMTDFEYMSIYFTDLTSTIKHDPAVCAMMRVAGNTAGHELPYRPLPLGASDAAAATQGGMRAAAFAAMDPTPAPYYHTRLDTPEQMQPKTVEACLDIVMEIAHQFDTTGLAPFEGSKVKSMPH